MKRLCNLCNDQQGQAWGMQWSTYIVVLDKLQGLREDLGSRYITPNCLGQACQLVTHAHADHIVHILAHREAPPQEMLLNLSMYHSPASAAAACELWAT